MNYTKLFYWLVVADNARSFFVVFVIIFTLISLISTIAYIAWGMSDSDPKKIAVNQRISRKWMWWSYPFMILFWSLFVFTPSKRDALLIVAGGQTINFLTTDSTARQVPHEVLNFVVSELKNMAQEAKVDLGINNQKEKILKEAQQMTPTQLLDRMKTDTTFRKIVLDQ